jgi:hypothetical protein
MPTKKPKGKLAKKIAKFVTKTRKATGHKWSSTKGKAGQYGKDGKVKPRKRPKR